MEMIDTHAHLNFEAFTDDWREVLDRALLAGVDKMIIVGTDLETSKRAVELAQEHKALYAAVGVHPHHARELQMNLNLIEQWLDQPKVVAVGEVGLDRHLYKQSKYGEMSENEIDVLYTVQKEVFKKEIEFARKHNKPLIIHSWEAGDDVLSMLDNGVRGVFHCFDGSKKYLRKILEANYYVSFTGQITYVPDRLEVAKEVPLDRLLLETDSPLISPAPLRGERNEPKNVWLIAEAHANSRGISLEEVDKATSENAERLFGLQVG